MQATKKPHGYHKIAVWQKDDRIRKSPLKFYVYYYSELSGDCQVSIFTELWRLSVAFCVTLWHMSIGCRVILPVPLQKIDAAPHTEGTAEADHDSLQSINCAIEKFHTFTSINSDCDVVLGTKKLPVISSSSVTIRRRPGVIGRPAIPAG